MVRALRAGSRAFYLMPEKGDWLEPGERTRGATDTDDLPDSGARMVFSVRYTYWSRADRLRATFEFATAPDEQSVVEAGTDCQPSTAVIYVPPNLLTEEFHARLKTDREIAEETGRKIDAHPWPVHGRRPAQFLLRRLPHR